MVDFTVSCALQSFFFLELIPGMVRLLTARSMINTSIVQEFQIHQSLVLLLSYTLKQRSIFLKQRTPFHQIKNTDSGNIFKSRDDRAG